MAIFGDDTRIVDSEGVRIREALRDLRLRKKEEVENQTPVPPPVLLPKKNWLGDEKCLVIQVTNDVTIELTPDTVRVWGAVDVWAILPPLYDGYRPSHRFRPPRTVKRPVKAPRDEVPAPAGHFVVSGEAAPFRIMFGEIKILISPDEKAVRIWNARHVQIMLPGGASHNLYEEPPPEPEWQDIDVVPID